MKNKLTYLLIFISIFFNQSFTQAQMINNFSVNSNNEELTSEIILKQNNNHHKNNNKKENNNTYNKKTYPKKEFKITKDSLVASSNVDSTQNNASGYCATFEVNKAFGLFKYSLEKSLGADVIFSYKFDDVYSIGLGVGFDSYTLITLVPVFCDLRANLSSNSKITTFCALDLGWAFGNASNFGGPILNPSLGVKFFVAPNMSLNLSIGFRAQENSEHTASSNHGVGGIENANFTNFKFGITF